MRACTRACLGWGRRLLERGDGGKGPWGGGMWSACSSGSALTRIPPLFPPSSPPPGPRLPRVRGQQRDHGHDGGPQRHRLRQHPVHGVPPREQLLPRPVQGGGQQAEARVGWGPGAACTTPCTHPC
jgi:hypothetical protein